LKHGEFGVSWLESGGREILSESSLRLVDRTFQPGDFCKRKIEDIQSGVVVSIDVKGKLVHAISDEPVEGWKDMSDLEGAAEMYLGDYVSCDDWIGQVCKSLPNVPAQLNLFASRLWM
jgi:ubiquitin-conjugating enzyme E2 O